MKRKIATLIAILVVLLSPFSAQTGAKAASSVRIIPPLEKTRYLALGAADFHPNRPGYVFQNRGNNLKVYSAEGGLTGQFTASVNLEIGAVIKKMRLNVRSNVIDTAMTVRLYARSLESGSVTLLGTVTAQRTAETIVAPDNYYQNEVSLAYAPYMPNHAYFVEADIPTSSSDYVSSYNWLCGVTLEYTQPDRLAATGVYNTSAAILIPAQPENIYRVDNGTLRHEGSADSGFYMIKLNLPHGAQITGFKMAYARRTTTKTAQAFLQYSDIASHNYANIGGATLTTAAGTNSNVLVQKTFSPVTVDSHSRSYWIGVVLPKYEVSNYVTAHAFSVAYTQPALSSQHTAMVAAVSFHPSRQSYGFYQHGRYLKHLSTPSTAMEYPRGYYIAPLDLPDGAVINSMKVNVYDTPSDPEKTVRVYLNRTTRMDPTEETLKQISSVVDTGYSTVTETNFAGDDFTIDHLNYSYWLAVDLPKSAMPDENTTGDYALLSVEIDYTDVFTNISRAYLPVAVR